MLFYDVKFDQVPLVFNTASYRFIGAFLSVWLFSLFRVYRINCLVKTLKLDKHLYNYVYLSFPISSLE